MVHKIVIVARSDSSKFVGVSYTLESEHDTESPIDVRSSVINTSRSYLPGCKNHIDGSIDMEFDHRRGCHVIAISVAFEQNHWADVDREWRLSFTLAICLIGHYVSAYLSQRAC